jgi:hypothetical protein
MSKYINSAGQDALLTWVRDNCNLLVLCSIYPTTYTEAYVTYNLGSIAMTSGMFTGPSDGPDGRYIQVDEIAAITIATAGTITHAALIHTGTSTLAYVTETESEGLVVGNEESLDAWNIYADNAI